MTENKNKVEVVIEYCGVCNFTKQCQELKTFINDRVPQANVICQKSNSRGSFEVKINEQCVHSKLQTLAFPLHEDVVENVRNCMEGKEMRKVAQQKITDCCIS